MPTIDEMYADLESADAAGDYELANVIASKIKQAQKSKPLPLKPQSRTAMPTPTQAAVSGAARGLGNLIAGGVRGAGSIGSTVLAPADYAMDYFLGDEDRNDQRRQKIDAGLMSLFGADPESASYQIGKVGTEIAGTLGAGGAIAKALPAGAPIAEAIATGGIRAGGMPGVGGMAARTIGGAISGGAAAGMVDPSQALTGAAIGGALPSAIPIAGTIARKTGGLVSDVLGLSTGAGGESVRQAARAGMAGGDRARSFTSNMRGDAPMTDALDIAKSNLDAMRAAKNAQYRSGMVDITSDKSVLDFSDVDNALTDAANITLFKGKVKNAKAESVRAEIEQAVDEWRSLDPSEFHTPEGFDALKQRIGAIVESIPIEERTAAKVGKDIYNSVKNAITKQAPAYAKVMRDYTQAADDIAQAEKALSLGGKASVDTAMRKLQSLTRNNVSTNYGNRLALAEQLQEKGGKEFMPALAGQSLSSLTPRGLQGVVGTGAVAGGGIAGGIPGAASALPFLAAGSPRLVGETAYGVGKAARGADTLMRLLLESSAVPVSTASILDLIGNQ